MRASHRHKRYWSTLGLLTFNWVNLWMPYRGFFGIRRAWLRSCGLEVGAGTRVATGSRFMGAYTTIADEVWIGPEVSVMSCQPGPIVIGSRVDIGPRVLLVSGSHETGDARRRAGAGTGEQIVIGDGTWIGAHSTILGGAHIGSGCIIAAGSLVRSGTYPDDSLLAGVPAVVKRML